MFGLEKLPFKTKVITVSVIFIFISMGLVYLKNIHSITVVKINDWIPLASDADGNWFFKANQIYVDDQNHMIKVWVKIVYSDNGKQEFLKTHERDEYKDINHSLSMVSMNYRTGKYKEDRIINYSNSGDVIGRDELSGKKYGFIQKYLSDKLLRKILE
jgi:hypothetical protein